MSSLVSYFASLSRNPLIAVAIPLALGTGLGRVTKGGLPWFQNVRKPPGQPPRLAFPIVWTILYCSMGYASHLLVRALDRSPSAAVRSHAESALKLYWSQLLLNLAWTPLFFGMRRTELALLDILAMVGTVTAMIQQTSHVDSFATTLFAPYLGWLSYATYLNAGIIYLNRSERSDVTKDL